MIRSHQKHQDKEIMKSRNILTKALKQLVDIRTLLKEAVPRESGISLEPIQIGSKRKKLPFCINNSEKERFTCWETWRGSSDAS